MKFIFYSMLNTASVSGHIPVQLPHFLFYPLDQYCRKIARLVCFSRLWQRENFDSSLLFVFPPTLRFLLLLYRLVLLSHDTSSAEVGNVTPKT
jgi:hypothetical protein